MGSGIWTSRSFSDYTTATKGVTMDSFMSMNYCAQDLYKSKSLSSVLNPYKVVRECRDSEEHPETVPVILALDVTGSMGDAAVKVAKQLNDIMTDLYENPNVKDIEFCVMAIGDMGCDRAPVQMSQFESDIRIAEQLDEVYFEAGGGGNKYESYTAAWYMGLYHTDLDCWKRGKKGIIITMGDELPNPMLPKEGRFASFANVIGDNIQGDIETKDLLNDVIEKFDVYHISIDDPATSYKTFKHYYDADEKWGNLLGRNYMVSNLNNLSGTITKIIIDHESAAIAATNVDGEITW